MRETTISAMVTAAPVGRVRQLAAASVGNAVEWFDWYAYTFLAVFFSRQIFPGSSIIALLNTFAVFAVGFVMRPLGGLILGALADRRGRRTALALTIALMGLGSLLTALVPTYAQAGPWGAVLLVIARLAQGLSLGGEFAASSTFLVESAPPGRRGLYSSIQYVTTTLGQLVASGVTAVLVLVLTPGQMSEWGWRVAFALGAVIALVGFWIRRGAEETRPELLDGTTGRPGLFEPLRRHPRASLLIVGLTVGGTVAYYSWTSYLSTWVQLTSGAPPARALLASTIGLAFFMVIQPVVGAWSDRVGRRLPLLIFGIGSAVATVPLFLLVSPDFVIVLLVQCAGLALTTGYTAVAAAVNAETFPARVRAAGIGFPYSLTVALFGGTAPFVGTLFVRWHIVLGFPIYIAVLCLVSALVFLRMRETAHQPLD